MGGPNAEFLQQHPHGTTLLSRDKPENLRQWGPDGIGYIDVAETICTVDDGGCPYYHYFPEQQEQQQDQYMNHHETTTPIHLLIASFRDQLCPRTIHNAFQRAQNPHRIYIRVIEQTMADSDLVDDAGCWDRYCSDYNPTNCQEFRNNVKIVPVDASKSKGPTDARSKLSAMIHWDYVHRHNSEMVDLHPVEIQDFCMQTDSHMDFSDNYDTLLMEMHERTQNDYAVLSTYVADISQNNQDERTVPNLCMVTFTTTIRNWGTKECIQLTKPKLTNAMWGAGLSFHRCHAELVVPVDPYLDNVFDGEEGSRGIRFFTHGYDVYTPDRVLVTHDYKKHQSNPVVHSWGGSLRKHQNNKTKNGNDQKIVWPFLQAIEAARPNVTIFGTKRVNLLLGIGPPPTNPAMQVEQHAIRTGRFGFGTRRSLQQAIEFTGIDLPNRKMVANKCGNLLWVPYEEHPDYGISEVLSRGLAGGIIDGDPTRTVVTTRILPASVSVMTWWSDVTVTIPVIAGSLLTLLVVLHVVTRRRQQLCRRKPEKHRN